jgi:hypothetical protein
LTDIVEWRSPFPRALFFFLELAIGLGYPRRRFNNVGNISTRQQLPAGASFTLQL